MRSARSGIALLLLLGRQEILHGAMTLGDFIVFIIAVFSLYDPVRKFAHVLQQLPAGAWARAKRSSALWTAQDDVRGEEARVPVLQGVQGIDTL